jgi:hypothetical protein
MNEDRPVLSTPFGRQDVSPDYAVGFPGVAHIVADLDDLDDTAIATPITAGRHRRYRASVLRRISSALGRRLMRRQRASLSAVADVAMAVAA